MKEDLESIDRLVNSAYRGENSKKGWTTEADLLDGQRTDVERLFELISKPGASIELAFGDDHKTLLGCVYLAPQGDECYLGMLSVDPNLQAQGVGRQLLDYSEKIARDRKCKHIKMTVIFSRTELIAYYLRRGYTLTGKTEPFPAGDPRFGVPKTPLHFVELIKVL